MRISPLRIAVALATALAALPGTLAAQQRTAAEARAVAADVQAWFGELEELHTRLETLQARALDDPQVGAAQEELGDSIRATMERIDPSVAGAITRMDAMEEEATAARQRGDEARLQELGAEAERIQRAFVAAHERALQQPEIAAQVSAFQQRLQRKMLELDPATERILSRFRELETRLAAEASFGP